MTLNPAQRAYIVRDHLLGPIIINLLLNAYIGWALFKDLAQVPVFGERSAASDLIVTSFALPVIVCLLTTPLVGLATRKGKAPALPNPLSAVPWLRWTPKRLWLRAAAFGACGLAVCAPPTIVGLSIYGSPTLDLMTFAWLKGVVCGLLAGLVSPAIALAAMADSAHAALRVASTATANATIENSP